MIFTKENIDHYDVWLRYRKIVTTRAMRVSEPFDAETREGKIGCPDGYVAIDSGGYPYPIARDEFERIYKLVPEYEEIEIGPLHISSELDPRPKALVEVFPLSSIHGTCTKCGKDYECSMPRYCAGCKVGDGIEIVVEHLHRECPTCGYVWLESCADYESGDPTK